MASGLLDARSIDRVADHVDTCRVCQAFLDTTPGAVANLGRLTADAPQQAFVEETEFRRGVARLNALVSDSIAGGDLEAGARGGGDESILSTPAPTDADTLPPGDIGATPRDPAQTPAQFGRYRILRTLGQGGMGAVYLAHDPQLDRQVALKIPHRATAGLEAVERFYRESRAAAKLDHPNICPVYDVGEIDGAQFLVMSYIDGQPLSERIRDGRYRDPGESAALVRKLALALAEAHEHGIVHRDLKPSNVMINQRGDPVVMDFGLAQLIGPAQPGAERLTQTGVVLGSPAYMSPEQVLGETQSMGPNCDVYSLGVILYELLTGRIPFQGPVASVLGQILANTPAPPSRHRPDLDPRLEAVCLKAMAKSIDDRYASMREFASALEEFARETPATPSRTAPTVAVAKLKQRSERRKLVGLPAVIAAGLLSFLGVAAAAIYYVQTDFGTLKIEVNDEAVIAKLTKEGLVIEDTETGRSFRITGKGELTKDSGTYEVAPGQGLKLFKITDEQAKSEVEAASFRLVRGETIRFRVALEPEPAPNPPRSNPTAQPTPPPAVRMTEREIAEWVLSVDGRVRVELEDGRVVDVNKPDDLPANFLRVYSVFIGFQSKYLPEDVERLAGLPRLHGVQLERYGGFEDDIFAPFAGMQELEGINLLGGSRITGKGLAVLASCPKLRSIGLDGCELTDAGCETLSTFQRLDLIGFNSPNVTPRGFEYLVKLPRLTALLVRGTPFPAEAAAHLKRARLINHLECTEADDAVVEQLGELPNLNRLWLFRSTVTDDGLAPIANLRQLQSLIVEGAPVRGPGLAHLVRLPSLTAVNLNDSEVDDEGLTYLAKISRLSSLILSKTRVTDAGMAQLSECKNLTELDLAETQVSDAGLPEIAKLKGLRYVNLTGTLVTADGVRELRAALPACNVVGPSP